MYKKQNQRLEESLKQATDEINKVSINPFNLPIYPYLSIYLFYLSFMYWINHITSSLALLILSRICDFKGNEIIRKLQNDSKEMKSKIKLKNILALEQEKLLQDKSSSIALIQKEIDELKNALSNKEEQLKANEKVLDELRKSSEESKRIIEDNKHGTSQHFFLVQLFF